MMAALVELAAGREKLFHVKCRFECPAPVYLHDLIVATHLFDPQEAATNAVKHGKAREIEISLEMKLERIILTVRDDGRGFLPPAGTTKGMGLRIMHYRAE